MRRSARFVVRDVFSCYVCRGAGMLALALVPLLFVFGEGPVWFVAIYAVFATLVARVPRAWFTATYEVGTTGVKRCAEGGLMRLFNKTWAWKDITRLYVLCDRGHARHVLLFADGRPWSALTYIAIPLNRAQSRDDLRLAVELLMTKAREEGMVLQSGHSGVARRDNSDDGVPSLTLLAHSADVNITPALWSAPPRAAVHRWSRID